MIITGGRVSGQPKLGASGENLASWKLLAILETERLELENARLSEFGLYVKRTLFNCSVKVFEPVLQKLCRKLGLKNAVFHIKCGSFIMKGRMERTIPIGPAS